jgi:hypothetical protein
MDGVVRKKWSDSEDRALRVFYPKHGPSWVGWPEVLNGRTKNSIKERARILGLRAPVPPRKERPEKPNKPKRKPAHKEGMHYEKVEVPYTPDPYEDYVIACMEAGMTPAQIDEKMKWYVGTTTKILTRRWEHEQ